MRDNGKVTQKEYVLSKDTTIVSRTDLHGNIVSANEEFIEASGFTWTELVGQPHNVLRHPDVPEAVFRDFWATLEEGKKRANRGLKRLKIEEKMEIITGSLLTQHLFLNLEKLSDICPLERRPPKNKLLKLKWLIR